MKKERKILRNCFGNSNKNTIFVVPNQNECILRSNEYILDYATAYPLCSYLRRVSSSDLAITKGVRSLFTYFTQLFNLNKMPNQKVKSSTAAKHSTRTTSKQTQSYCVTINAQASGDEGRFLRLTFRPVYNEQNPLTAIGRAVTEFYARRPNGRITGICVTAVPKVRRTAQKAAKQPAPTMPLSQRLLAYAGGLFMLISTGYIIYNLYISW